MTAFEPGVSHADRIRADIGQEGRVKCKWTRGRQKRGARMAVVAFSERKRYSDTLPDLAIWAMSLVHQIGAMPFREYLEELTGS